MSKGEKPLRESKIKRERFKIKVSGTRQKIGYCLHDEKKQHRSKMVDTTLKINDSLEIPTDELKESFARSSGPGGQHVNKTETKVELRWQPNHSKLLHSLKSDQKTLFLERIMKIASKDGVVVIQCSDHRSQKRNRETARKKLRGIVLKALETPKIRKATKPSRSKKEKRLKEKRQRSLQKKERQWKKDD